MAAHLKVLALVGFMLCVVLTPRTWLPAFAGYLAALLLAISVSGVPLRYVVPRMVVEVPFLAFAALMPFLSTGPRIEVLGVAMSRPGLEAGTALVIKGSLGVLASLTLAATTEPHELLSGLRRLRVPAALVDVMAFMLRYLDVVTDELRRMRIAVDSRGFSARSPRHWAVLATSLGALFVRSYERGERVHRAMLSRGYER